MICILAHVQEEQAAKDGEEILSGELEAVEATYTVSEAIDHIGATNGKLWLLSIAL